MNNALVVLGVIYLQIFFGECTDTELPPLHEPCIKDNVAANKLLVHLHEDFTFNEGVDDINKVIACMYKEQNYVNADDTLNNVQFHDFLAHHLIEFVDINLGNPEEAATNAMDTCKDVQGTDLGDTLVKNYNCIIKYLRNLAN